MPDMRMIEVTGDPIFMLTGSSRAMVAAGPSPGRTPTTVPRTDPMRHQSRLTGLRAIWNPCRRPAKSNMDARSFFVAGGLEEEPPWEGGHKQPLEDEIDNEARGNTGECGHPHLLLFQE